MNIALCTDDNYAKYCMITIVSILENNADTKCCVYVLTDSLSEKNKNLFKYLSDYYKQQILVTVIPPNSFENLKVRSRYPKSMYYRFLLPDSVHEEKVLYLDCDIINRKSLLNFYDTDLTGKAAAVVEDAQGDDVLLHNRIKYSGTYFNSGVMLMNLDYWRKHNIKEQLVEFIENNPDCCYYPDQDALNIVLTDKVIFTPYIYNCQQSWYMPLDRILFSYTKWEQVYNSIQDPVIVHYTSTNKPWFKECTHPHNEWFIQYALIHKKIGFKSKRRISITRSFVSKLIEYIIYKLQNSILVVKRQ